MTADVASDPLSYAASLLDAVGADREQVPADIALECLYAAELLELAGARFRPIELDDADPRHRIRTALISLAALDPDAALRREVSEAIRIARDALRRLA